jgi:zinc protease
LVEYALGEQALPSPSQRQELGTRLLATIDSTVLQARARQWLTEGRRVLVAIREQGDDSVASEAALAELWREVRTRALPPPREPELAIELMPVLPNPGSIVSGEHIEAPALQLWTLGNGAKVVFRRARPGSGQALLRGLTSLRTDTTADAEEQNPWNRLHAPRLVQMSGAGAHDAETLSRLLSKRSTKIHLAADVDASSSVQDFETTLQLLHLYLTAPRRDPQAFEQLLAGMRKPPAPQQAFLNAMFPELDARAIAEQLNLDQALAAYRTQFADLSGVEFVLVADLEEDRVRSLVERYLASLPGMPGASDEPIGRRQRSNAQEPAARRESTTPAGGIRRVRLPNRPGAESQVVMRFSGTAPPSAAARVELEALEAYLRLRLREVLRERLGAIYDAEVSSGWDANASWSEIRFDCQPADAEKLQRATLEIIAAVGRAGIPDTELDALRAQHAAQFPRAFHEDRFWLEELVHASRERVSARRILELPNLSAHITRDALRLAARRHLRLDHYVDAVWSPGGPADAAR